MATLSLRQGEGYNILAGPGKYDLITAFGYCGPLNGRISVNFEVQLHGANQSHHFWVHINSLKWGDGDGQSWNFEGRSEKNSSRRVRGYYSTKHRQGTFEVTS